MSEKKGGCIQKGGGILLAVFVLFMIINSISNYFSDDSATDTTSQPSVSTIPAETVTSPPAKVEPTEPQPQVEEPIEPEPEVEEPAQPEPEEAIDVPQQQEDTQTEPSTSGNESSILINTVEEAPSSTEIITRYYTWEYGGSDWTWEIPISEAGYEYFKGIPRLPTTNYSVYVTHPLDDPYIDRLVEIIKEAADEKGYNELQIVEFAITFVQSLPYTVDSVTSPFDEYPRYPIETLVDEGGDCEDTSILLASLLHEMGYGVVLLRLPGHMAVGVKGGDNMVGTYWLYEGNKYYYIETTGSGWQIGEVPEEYADSAANVLTMEPVSIITHEWSLEDKGLNTELKVVVTNLGTATAYNVQVLIGFDAGNDKIWSKDLSNFHNLKPGHQLTSTFVLRPPPVGVHTRLVVQIGMGGYSVSESHSGWFDF